MANSLRDLIFGGNAARRELVEVITPRRGFADVILPPATLRALRQALVQIEKHDVLFHEWGLAERHSTGLGLAFNFAGPPGTGKTICAEAIAHVLGRSLLVVRYAELESMWAGSTGKNVAAVFRWAAEENAVLFFDEADAIASRRFARTGQGYEREANAVVNVLLRELEEFSGVVIFATNLAANFDPAFERRIRNHILFEMPGAAEREQIWRVQLHERKTPLAEDVDFRELAERYAVSGGDIKNAVLKAAQAAISEPGADQQKRIGQAHFEASIREVIAAKSVMEQSLFGADGDADAAQALLPPALGDALSEQREEMNAELGLLAERLDEVEAQQRAQLATLREAGALERRRDEERAARQQAEEQLRATLREVQAGQAALLHKQQRVGNVVGGLSVAALVLSLAALAVALLA
jgi:SpoVK/Ycf46/Vps4 family AAA+-type ATPase